jgi:hypothetical protein
LLRTANAAAFIAEKPPDRTSGCRFDTKLITR